MSKYQSLKVIYHPLYKETLVLHLVATSIYLSQIYSYYVKGDRSPLTCSKALFYCVYKQWKLEKEFPNSEARF